MYYTIEGKRFLCILYVIGLLTGTFFINVSIKMNLFRVSDFLGFTEYVKTLEGLDSNAFFSYVCMVRVRQLILFFACIFLFSPYVIYCVLDFVLSAEMGIFISVLVAEYGIMGMIKGVAFLIPHYLFFGMMMVIIYIYLFQKTPFSRIYRISAVNQSGLIKNQKLLENKIIVVIFCLIMFCLGCYTETFINPVIVRWIFH